MWLWDSVLISLHRFSCLWRENLDSDFPEWPWTLSDISFETAPVLSLGTALKSKRLRSKGELGVRGSSDGWGPSSDDNLQMAYCCGLRWGYPFVLWCAHENVRFSDFFFFVGMSSSLPIPLPPEAPQLQEQSLLRSNSGICQLSFCLCFQMLYFFLPVSFLNKHLRSSELRLASSCPDTIFVQGLSSAESWVKAQTTLSASEAGSLLLGLFSVHFILLLCFLLIWGVHFLAILLRWNISLWESNLAWKMEKLSF